LLKESDAQSKSRKSGFRFCEWNLLEALNLEHFISARRFHLAVKRSRTEPARADADP